MVLQAMSISGMLLESPDVDNTSPGVTRRRVGQTSFLAMPIYTVRLLCRYLL
jgi:hypothetical protein